MKMKKAMIIFNRFRKNRTVIKLMPVIVLTLICLISTSVLVGTYGLTAPVIEKNNQKKEDMARKGVFPMAGVLGFTKITNDLYLSNNKGGLVIITEDKGFGGKIKVMTGIDKRGKITGVKITDHKETPGLGTKTMTEEFLSQYLGKSKIDNSTAASEKEAIDGISGATVSSDAIYRAVDKALAIFKEMGGIPHE